MRVLQLDLKHIIKSLARVEFTGNAKYATFNDASHSYEYKMGSKTIVYHKESRVLPITGKNHLRPRKVQVSKITLSPKNRLSSRVLYFTISFWCTTLADSAFGSSSFFSAPFSAGSSAFSFAVSGFGGGGTVNFSMLASLVSSCALIAESRQVHSSSSAGMRSCVSGNRRRTTSQRSFSAR